MKINEYRIVNGSKNRPLTQHVNYQIDNGWQPLGQPYLDKNGVEKQAMIRYEATTAASRKPNKKESK